MRTEPTGFKKAAIGIQEGILGGLNKLQKKLNENIANQEANHAKTYTTTTTNNVPYSYPTPGTQTTYTQQTYTN